MPQSKPTVWPDRVIFYEHVGDTVKITTVWTNTQHPRILSYLQQDDLSGHNLIPRSLFYDEIVEYINQAYTLQGKPRYAHFGHIKSEPTTTPVQGD